jgi:hypothetical protein
MFMWFLWFFLLRWERAWCFLDGLPRSILLLFTICSADSYFDEFLIFRRKDLNARYVPDVVYRWEIVLFSFLLNSFFFCCFVHYHRSSSLLLLCCCAAATANQFAFSRRNAFRFDDLSKTDRDAIISLELAKSASKRNIWLSACYLLTGLRSRRQCQ